MDFYAHIIVKLTNEIDLLLHHFVYNGYTALSEYLRAPLAIVASLFIAILGYGVMLGTVPMKVGAFVKAIIKIALIYVAVTEWSFISHYLVSFVNESIGGVGDALIAASPIHIPAVDGMNGALQLTLIEFVKVGNVVAKSGSIGNLWPYIDALIIWIAGYVIVGFGLFEILLAKIMLAILFIFTPLIVLFCFFKPTRGMFDRWLGSIVSYALLQLFAMLALTLALSLAYWWVAMHITADALHIGNVGTWPVVIIALLCFGILKKAWSLASSIGGNVSTGSGSSMVAGMVGGAVGGAVTASTMGAKGLLHAGNATRAAKGAVDAGALAGVSGLWNGANNAFKGIQQQLRQGNSSTTEASNGSASTHSHTTTQPNNPMANNASKPSAPAANTSTTSNTTSTPKP